MATERPSGERKLLGQRRENKLPLDGTNKLETAASYCPNVTAAAAAAAAV